MSLLTALFSFNNFTHSYLFDSMASETYNGSLCPELQKTEGNKDNNEPNQVFKCGHYWLEFYSRYDSKNALKDIKPSNPQNL